VKTSGIRSGFAGVCAAAFFSAAVRSFVQPITFIVKVLAAALVTGTQHYQLAVLSHRDSKVTLTTACGGVCFFLVCLGLADC